MVLSARATGPVQPSGLEPAFIITQLFNKEGAVC